jgi:hypothetical protein
MVQFRILKKGSGWIFIKYGDSECLAEATTLAETYWAAKEKAQEKQGELTIQDDKGNIVLSFGEDSKDRFVPINDSKYFVVTCDELGLLHY